MPTGPRGERRRAVVIGNAAKVLKIAGGEKPEDFGVSDDGKDSAANALGKNGGVARAQ